MDCYVEHLVPMKKDAKTISLMVLVWIVMCGFVGLSLMILPMPFSVILAGVAIFGAIKLTKSMNVEYEYIFTNGEIDIDLIIAKSNRKRLHNFKCSQITRVERFNAENPLYKRENIKNASVYCNADDSNVYTLIIDKDGKGTVCITMDIPANMQQQMLPYMDKLLARTAFKEN